MLFVTVTDQGPLLIDDRIAHLFQSAFNLAQKKHRSPVWQDLARLSALFTTDRSGRARDYLRDPGLRRAYLAYYAPLNAAKIAHILSENDRDFPDQPEVLDLGAGPLSGILGATVAKGALGPSMAVDLAEGALKLGEELRQQSKSPTAPLEIHSTDIRRFKSDRRFDLVVMANVLNEFGDPRKVAEKRWQALMHAASFLKPTGSLLVVSPSQRIFGRALMEERDRVFEANELAIRAPCTGSETCPLLERPKDWCHSERQLSLPRELVRTIKRAKIEAQRLKYSYLLLKRNSDEGSGHRVLSNPLGKSGARLLCQKEGLKEATSIELSTQRGALLHQLSRNTKLKSPERERRPTNRRRRGSKAGAKDA